MRMILDQWTEQLNVETKCITLQIPHSNQNYVPYNQGDFYTLFTLHSV